MKLKLYISLFICILSAAIVAQEATLKISVSKNKLGINQRLRVEFSIDKQGGDNFTPPSFTNFRVVGGPSQSVSQSWINGNVSFQQSYTYIIEPTIKGEITIGSATVKIGGKLIKSDPAKIIVLDAVEIPKDPNDPNYIAQQNIHLVAEISQIRPYVGEGIYVEYRLYVSENVSVYDTSVTEAPTYVGFWNQDIKISDFPVKMGKYNGEDYRYIVLQKALLIPTKTGKLSIDPMKMDIVIGVPSGRSDFFGNAITRNVRREFASAKKIINPKELPIAGKPENFAGAVGAFDFTVSLSKDILKANETSLVEIAVSGKGNLKLFELPAIATPAELEMYQPERKERVRISSTGISGAVTDTYTVVPLFKGKYKIPSVSFSYFNPKEEQYKTIATDDFYVDVQEGKELVRADTTSSKKQTVLSADRNFRYIATRTHFVTVDKTDFFKSTLFYILLLLPMLAIPIGIYIGRKNEERNNDLVGNKLRKAQKLAKKYLSEAQKQLGKKEAFYEALERALHNYLKAKLGLETADISKEKIAEILENKKVEKNTILQFTEVLQSSDFARYTPYTANQMKEEFERAKNVIIQLDKQL
jgi:hypothetical protein